MRDDIQRLSLSEVEVSDDFWSPRLETNRLVTLAHQYDHIKANGCLDNFRRVLGEAGGEFEGPTFMDANAYKWLEAASYTLATDEMPTLAEKVDEVVSLIERTQADDGYLFTYLMVTNPDKRWTNFSMMHELYCAGHLIEAAVAHAGATDDDRLLDVARRFADHLYEEFGPDGEERIPGHQEIELALLRLYHATDEQRYLRLAELFVDRRGRDPSPLAAEFEGPPVFERASHPIEATRDDFLDDSGEYDGRFAQDHRPVREQEAIEGHSVRATNLYTAVVRLAQETGDTELFEAARRVWQNMVSKRMYVTGGIGSSPEGESFTDDYDLPNDTAFAETCAAVGGILWGQAMFESTGEAEYVNVLERILYNGFLSGVSLDGTRFFYANPLEATQHRRQEWLYIACCPPNLARLLASFESYIYATSDARETLFVNLYVGSRAETEIAGRPVEIEQTTDYPWDGTAELALSLDEPTAFTLKLRRPDWADDVSVRVNGQEASADHTDGYAVLDRTWQDGDQVTLSAPMSVDPVVAHPEVRTDAGMAAIRRGPVVYCLEGVDNPAPVRYLILDDPSSLSARHDESLLDGVTVVEGDATVERSGDWDDRLYRSLSAVETDAVSLTAVPYYAWNNREQSAMAVWLPLA
ncbi:MAG: glycoside hydrolase family 127 protein [Haloarculaceae archaeon]